MGFPFSAFIALPVRTGLRDCGTAAIPAKGKAIARPTESSLAIDR
jgi:hypothetical protein